MKMNMLKVKEKYKGVTISKTLQIGTVTFNSEIDPKYYSNYKDLGFEELFEEEIIPVKITRPVMNMNQYFDKIFCINLKRREDRWKESEKEIWKHSLNVERFEAIDCQDRNISPHNACTMSHIEILRMQIENKWKRILILEDDFELAIFNWNDVLENVPDDWDMLYLGGNNVLKPLEINSNLGKIKKTYTTSSYGITLETAKKAMPFLKKFNAPIDVMYANEIQTISNCYIFTPSLCWQKPGYSDIELGVQNYDFMKQIPS